MAQSYTIPEVWRKVVLAGLRKNLVAEKICNQKFKEEMWGYGDTLHILSIGALTDNAYTGSNITYEALTDAESQLVVNTRRYVAFYQEDYDKALSNVEFLGELLTDAGYQIADTVDTNVLAEYANATLDSYETGSTAWQFTYQTCAEVPAFFASLKRQIRKANAPAGNMFVVGPAELEEAINIYFGNKGAASVKSDDVITNGFFGRYFGMNVYTSNNVTTGDSSTTHGLAGVEGTAIGLAADVITDEGIRLEGRIADGYRFLGISGIKTYRPAISIDVNLNDTVIATS